MFSVIRFFIFLGLLTSFAFGASVRSQVSLLEASADIKLKSQKIAVAYLTFCANPKKFLTKKNEVIRILNELDSDFEMIDRSTKEAQSSKTLELLRRARGEIKIFTEEMKISKISEQNHQEILSNSDIMLQGAIEIEKMLDFELLSEEAKTVIEMKNVSFLIEKALKYYLALRLQSETKANQKHLNDTIKEVESALEILNEYNYAVKNYLILTKLMTDWKTLKQFYTQKELQELENIILLTAQEVQSSALLLEKNHNKEQ